MRCESLSNCSAMGSFEDRIPDHDYVVYVGNNHEDSSLYFVGKTIAERLPNSVIVAKPEKKIHHAKLIVNIDWEHTLKLAKVRRFFHFEKLVTVLAGDFIEPYTSEKLAIIGDAFEFPLIVHSDYSRNLIMDFARKWLSPTKLRELDKNLHLVRYGIEPQFQYSVRTDPTKWIVPYNRIDRTWKDNDLHMELTTMATRAIEAKYGVTLDHLFIASQNLWMEVKPEEWPAYRFLEQPKDRKDFHALIQDRGMFFCTCKSESFGIYYLELLFTGAIGFFVDKPWVRALLPAYPFVGPAKDLPAMALEIFGNYDHMRNQVKVYVDTVLRPRYNLDAFVQRIVEIGLAS